MVKNPSKTKPKKTIEEDDAPKLKRLKKLSAKPQNSPDTSPEKEHSKLQQKMVQIQISDHSFQDEEDFMKTLQQQVKQEKKQQKQAKKQQKNPSKKSKGEVEKDIILQDNPEKPCKDLKYVMTGNFKTTNNRDDIKKLITDLGGKVTGQVSGQTNVLLYGFELEDGRDPSEGNKYKKAQSSKTLIVSEEQFSQALREKTGKDLSSWLGNQLNKMIEKKYEYKDSFLPQDQGKTGPIQIDDMMEIEHDSQELWTDIYKP